MDILYSIANYLVEPYTLLLLFLWAATLWMIWRSEPIRGKGWVFAAVLLLTIASIPLTAVLVSWPLESRYPYQTDRPEDAQVIVVLGGGLRLLDPDRQKVFPADDTVERCLHAVELYQAGPACPVLVAGGQLPPVEQGPPLAHAMADFLQRLGVSRQDIFLEEYSTNTYENAVFSSEIVQARGWNRAVLVTDALHMERARRCFEKLGIEVIPSPCRPTTETFQWSWEYVVPSVGGLVMLKRAAHEWLGLLWYRLHGRI